MMAAFLSPVVFMVDGRVSLVGVCVFGQLSQTTSETRASCEPGQARGVPPAASSRAVLHILSSACLLAGW